MNKSLNNNKTFNPLKKCYLFFFNIIFNTKTDKTAGEKCHLERDISHELSKSREYLMRACLFHKSKDTKIYFLLQNYCFAHMQI